MLCPVWVLNTNIVEPLPKFPCQGRRNDLVFGTGIELKQWCLLFFEQYMSYFE